MKKLIFLMIVVLVGFAYNPLFAQKSGNKVVCFKSDMDCSHCEQTLNDYLKFEKGVKNLKVDHISNTILVEYKEGKNSDEALAEAVEKKGYKATKISREEYEKEVKHAQEVGHEHEHEQHHDRAQKKE